MSHLSSQPLNQHRNGSTIQAKNDGPFRGVLTETIVPSLTRRPMSLFARQEQSPLSVSLTSSSCSTPSVSSTVTLHQTTHSIVIFQIHSMPICLGATKLVLINSVIETLSFTLCGHQLSQFYQDGRKAQLERVDNSSSVMNNYYTRPTDVTHCFFSPQNSCNSQSHPECKMQARQ